MPLSHGIRKSVDFSDCFGNVLMRAAGYRSGHRHLLKNSFFAMHTTLSSFATVLLVVASEIHAQMTLLSQSVWGKNFIVMCTMSFSTTVFTVMNSEIHAQTSPLADSMWGAKPQTKYEAPKPRNRDVQLPNAHSCRGTCSNPNGTGRQSFVFLHPMARVKLRMRRQSEDDTGTTAVVIGAMERVNSRTGTKKPCFELLTVVAVKQSRRIQKCSLFCERIVLKKIIMTNVLYTLFELPEIVNSHE